MACSSLVRLTGAARGAGCATLASCNGFHVIRHSGAASGMRISVGSCRQIGDVVIPFLNGQAGHIDDIGTSYEVGAGSW